MGPTRFAAPSVIMVKNGADVIKAAVSGGVLSMADEVDTPQFTPEEVAALADETHRLRKKLAVHCHGDQAAKEAIAAGVDSIEHGSFMKPETLTLMKTKGTYLVATLMATEWIMGKTRPISAALAGQGQSRRGRALRDVPERRETGSEDRLRHRRRRLPSRSEREGIQAHGRSWDGANRRLAIRDISRRRVFRHLRRKSARWKKANSPTSSPCRAIPLPTSPRPSAFPS